MSGTDNAITFESGRPCLPEIIRAYINENGSLGIAGEWPHCVRNYSFMFSLEIFVSACGPEGLVMDVRNAFAEVQLAIVSGTTNLSEVFLHTEAFRCILHSLILHYLPAELDTDCVNW